MENQSEVVIGNLGIDPKKDLINTILSAGFTTVTVMVFENKKDEGPDIGNIGIDPKK